MIEVLTTQDVIVVYDDTDACAVEEGTLIIFNDQQGMSARAGYAPGFWKAFEIKSGG